MQRIWRAFGRQVQADFHAFNKRVRVRGGFRLGVATSRRRWNTQSGKANFLTAPGLDEDPLNKNAGRVVLTTVRSHDRTIRSSTAWSTDKAASSVDGM